VLAAGALASQEANQDPIDLAFMAAAKERRVFSGAPAFEPVSFTPFDAKNRRTEAVVEQGGRRLRVMKGAVRTVAQACGLELPAIEALEARVGESALKGYRALAVARGPEAGAPALIGLVTLYDPPAGVLSAPNARARHGVVRTNTRRASGSRFFDYVVLDGVCLGRCREVPEIEATGPNYATAEAIRKLIA